MNKNRQTNGGNQARIAIRTSLIRLKDKQGETEQARRQNMQEALSPQTQLEIGIEFCERKGLKLDVDASLSHADLDVSGSKIPWRKRPEIVNHYEDAKKGIFQHLVFYKLARAGRNLRDTLDMIDAFEALGVTIHGIKENVISSNPADRTFMHMMLVWAEHQAKDIAENIQDVVLTRAKNGDINGRYPLMWLRRSGSSFEIIPEVEASIRRMVALRMDGLGYLRIAKVMNEEGLRTAKGCPWNGGMTYKYLSTTYIESMTGTAYLNRDLPHDHPHHVVIPDKFPPILSEEEAQALRTVQAHYRRAPMKSVIAGAGTWQNNIARIGRQRADSKYLLAGKLQCAVCGHAMLSLHKAKETRSTQRSYRCAEARTFPAEHVKGGKEINANSLEEAVLRVVRHVLQEPPPAKGKLVRPQKKQRGATQIKNEMTVLVDLLMGSNINRDVYNQKYQSLEAEMKTLEQVGVQSAQANFPNAARLAAQAMTTEHSEVTREQLRQLICLTVSRVEFPVLVPNVFIRKGHETLRLHARVHLAFPTAEGIDGFLVPVYTSRYLGTKGPLLPDIHSDEDHPMENSENAA